MASDVGQRIKALRKSHVPKLTQTDLAKAVGVDQSVISDIERGAGFGAETLMKLCAALNSTARFIMLGSSEQDFEESQLVGFYRHLTPPLRQELMEAARYLARKAERNSAAMPFQDSPQKHPKSAA